MVADLSNWAVLIGDATVVIGAMTLILDSKLKSFRDNQRLQYRYEICSFAGDLRNGIHKTRQEFEAIFEMYDRYEEIVIKLKQKNSYIDSEMAYIKKKYDELDELERRQVV